MMFRKKKKTSLEDLRGLVEKIDEFNYRNHYAEVSRCGSNAGSEFLEGESGDNAWMRILWQWRGQMERGEGMKDTFLYLIEGALNRNFWSGDYRTGSYRYSFNSSFSEPCKDPDEIRNGEIMREIVSIAKEKYLQQTVGGKKDERN